MPALNLQNAVVVSQPKAAVPAAPIQAAPAAPKLNLSTAKVLTADQAADAASGKQYNALFPNVTESDPTKNLENIPRAVGNLPTSFATFLKNLGTAVVHPIRTAEGIGSSLIGAGEKIGNVITDYRNKDNPLAITSADRLPDQHEQTFNNLVDALKTRYGSLDNLQRSAVNDPFGIGSDIFAILSGGASIADSLSGASATNDAINAANKVATAEEAAQIPSRIGATGALDKTISAVAAPVVKGIPRLSGAVASQVLGAETGTGAASVKGAYNAGAAGGEADQAFTNALRGKSDPEQIVNDAKTAVQNIRDARGEAYVQQLKDIGGNTKSLDISPIQDTLDKSLAKFGVKEVTNPDTGQLELDFSRSSIANNGSARADIQGVYDTVKNWGTQSGDRTAIGLDTLKKQLGDFYSPSGSARAFVQSVKSSVSDILQKQVPGYAEMTKGYQSASNLLDDIQSATGIGSKAKVDTVFTKLTTAFKSDNALRQEIIGQMTTAGDIPTLESKIAGANMNSWIPKGLVGKGVDITALYHGLSSIFAPQTLPILLSTSPRIVGEFVRGLGVASQYADKLTNFLNKLTPALKAAIPAVRVNQLQGNKGGSIIPVAHAETAKNAVKPASKPQNSMSVKDSTAIKTNALPSNSELKRQISFRESGVSNNSYTTVNHNRGSVDLGKYQINTKTLATYSKQFLGKTVSPDEFLNSSQLQEKFMDAEIQHLKDLGVKKFDTMLALHHMGFSDISTKRINSLKTTDEVKKYLANRPSNNSNES